MINLVMKTSNGKHLKIGSQEAQMLVITGVICGFAMSGYMVFI